MADHYFEPPVVPYEFGRDGKKYELDENGQLPPLVCAVDGCEVLHPNAFVDDLALQGWRCPAHDPTEIAMRAFDDIYEAAFDMRPYEGLPFENFRRAAVTTAIAELAATRNVTDVPTIVCACGCMIRDWMKHEREMA